MVRLEQSAAVGRSSTTLPGLTFRDHRSGGEPVGLRLENARAVLSHSTFRDNGIGIISVGGSTLANGGGIDIDDSNTTKTFPAGLLP